MASTADERMEGREHGDPPAGYRLPPSTHPGSVRLQVSDLERSLEYYGTVLGLRVLERGEERAGLGAEEGGRPLVELRSRAGATRVPRSGRLGLYHFALLLPGRAHLGAFLHHLSERGIRAGSADHLVSEALYLTDPDGLGIEVYRDRPRSEWRVEGGQLRMTTDPLDVRSLLAESESTGGTWSGAPPGTVLGHVHLFVQDLEQASGFYHEGLGLDRVVWNYPGALFLSAGGYHHHLGVNTWASRAPRPRESDAQLLEWSLVVPGPDDVEGVAVSLAGAGYEVERRDEAVVVADPWGTRLRVRPEDRASSG